MTKTRAPRGALRQFLLDHLHHTGDECLIWPFGKRSRYGSMRDDQTGLPGRPHIIMCRWVHGERPPGQQACHSCGNVFCINPNHLRWGTPLENAQDKVKHGTTLHGTRNPNSKLKQDAVDEMRRRVAAGEKQCNVARQFGIRPSYLSAIVNRKRWV